MASFNSFTVYGIGSTGLGLPKNTPQLMGFDRSNVNAKPAPSGTKLGSVDIYGIIQEYPTGLNVNPTQFYVVETVPQIVAKFS